MRLAHRRVGEEGAVRAGGDRAARGAHGHAIGLARKQRGLAAGVHELHVVARRLGPAAGEALGLLGEVVESEPTAQLDVGDDVVRVLAQPGVDVVAQLAAHHDIDDARRDRHRRRDRERGCESKPRPERHGSRST